MSSLDIRLCSRAVADKICQKVNKSVVFVDNVSAEILHWYNGLTLFLNAGAHNIKEYSTFESGGLGDRKAVFIINGPLHGRNLLVMRDIVRGSRFQYIIVITNICPEMHALINHQAPSEHGATAAFDHVQDQILGWMGNMNYTVEIEYMPLLAVPITANLVLLPSHANVFPLIPDDIQHVMANIQTKAKDKTGDIEFEHLSQELQLQLKLLVCSLNGLLDQYGVSEDCYAIGATSAIVAGELASLPWAKHRRKTSQKRKASVLLIDRSVDIGNVVAHHTDNLLDKIRSNLPRLASHYMDVQVDMTDVSSANNTSAVLPGCLAHPNDAACLNLLKVMANRKVKEGVMEVQRQLIEAASSSNIKPSLAKSSTQLRDNARMFRDNPTALRKHSGVIQMALAVQQYLDATSSSNTSDKLLAIERGMLQTIENDSFTRALGSITELINKEMNVDKDLRELQFTDILLLVMFAYSVVNRESLLVDREDEQTLQAALLSMVLEDENELPAFLADIVGKDRSIDNIRVAMQEVFTKIQSLSAARDKLHQFRSVYKSGRGIAPSSLHPLIKQVIAQLYAQDKPELTDIHHKSTGLRDLIKSSFGLFMNVSKARASDHPLLFVVILGGTTATEVRQITEAASSASQGQQVVVVSTQLLCPEDLLRSVLTYNHLRPPSDVIDT